MLTPVDQSPWSGQGFEFVQEPLSPSGLVLAARGELDAAAVPKLRELLETAVGTGRTPVIIDLSEVSFIDSLSLATIVRAQQRLGGAGRMALVARHPYVLLIVEAGGLDSVLSVFNTRAEAESYVHHNDEPTSSG